MSKKINIAVGTKFGFWTILTEQSIAGKIKCRCNCGFEKMVRTYHLRSGASTKCRRCSQSGPLSKLFGGYGEISSHKWKKLRTDALARNLPFTITIKQAWNLFLSQDRHCALSGIEIRHQRSISDPTGTASFDRIDSSKGYVKGNVQWVHKQINRMKGNLDENDFIRFCKSVVSHARMSLEEK